MGPTVDILKSQQRGLCTGEELRLVTKYREAGAKPKQIARMMFWGRSGNCNRVRRVLANQKKIVRAVAIAKRRGYIDNAVYLGRRPTRAEIIECLGDRLRNAMEKKTASARAADHNGSTRS